MSATGVVGAEIPSKQECTEREDVNILIFVNVVFSLLPDAKNINSCNTAQNKCVNGAIADVVKEHPCYHSNISIEKNPDKIYAFEYDIQCQDLYCDENGECIDPIGAYTKILSACSKVDDYLCDLVFPPESKIQVCLNVMGFEPISDIAWGFAFMADACCPNNVEDEILNELIMDEYEPYFIDYIQKSWKVNVIYIGLMEYGVVFEIFNQQEKSKSSNHVDKSKNGTSNLDNSYDDKPSEDTPKNNEPDSSIVLEGHVSKTRVNLSSFISFDHILDCIPPFAVVRFIDRLTGVDKIENRMKESLNKSIMEYARGNSEEGWRHLKEAGGASLDYTHKRLDLISYFPGVGTIAGITNGWLYIFQESYVGFNLGDIDEANRLNDKAFNSFVSAVPIYKIARYGRGVFQSGRVIYAGSRNVRNAKRELALAREAYIEANRVKKTLKGATKAQRGPAIRNRYAAKQAVRNAEVALDYARNDVVYRNALKQYGIPYKDVLSNYKELFHGAIYAMDRINTPFADVVQNFLFQVRDPDSITNDAIRNVQNGLTPNE